MKQQEGRIIGNRYSTHGETLLYRGTGYNIDRTNTGRAWCIAKGMAPAFTVTAGGESFTVYAGVIRSVLGVDMDAACAIPA